ncbi:D-alanyl-D-alanine carboxypeptidase family protein [Antarcticirhabdus aurantiaca]|uniref:D-alanyl-D-alanine carboxypeptidase n=1 Tax=Antarcticirhabdus aurantiaca TaxID=2606717 RepID=A0ACD4NJ55_9HYPH|nr:D-alanyl-D-alanine carboxypeptidase family protein [Antarcticirhabdus aurantiaca]WAJ26907.1 D-alanyl-D-alanine carboxypeptidase [Jeongeuplla avenae]
MTSSLLRRLGRLAGRPLAIVALAATLGACQSADVGRAGFDAVSMARSYAPVVEHRAPAALVIDARSGRTLYEDDADALRYPASLTKLMTLYLLFEAVEQGRLNPDTPLTISANAASKPPSKLGAKPGDLLTVRQAVTSLAVRSANDVATVVAENLAGSEEAFANRMNAKARALGMSRTHFNNASGLPDVGQVTTARDMARLALAIRHNFPSALSVFSLREFEYGGRTIKATNKLLGKVPGIDGMKTGFIRDSGFHLVASAERGGRRIIVVVMGGETGMARDARVTALVDTYLGPATGPF